MYKVKLAELNKAQGLFGKLFNAQYDDIKLSYRMSKMAKKINAALDKLGEDRMKLIDEHGERNDKNELIIETETINGRPTQRYKMKDKVGFEKIFEDMLETEIELDIWGVPVEALDNIHATPNEINLIEPFLAPEEEAEKA